MTSGIPCAVWAKQVAGDAQVMPTHGFGSFCSATETVGLASTVAEQQRSNPAFRLSQDEFVTELLAGLDAFPAYYAHMGPANAAGPPAIDLSLPAVADPVELRRRIDAGEWVVDLRSRQVFAAGHLRGTLSFDGEGNAVTYLGWLLPWGTPVTLLGDSLAQVEAMQRDLARIGIDRPAAHAVGSPASWALDAAADVTSFRRAGFAELAAAQTANPDLLVLDLRRNLEWADGHVAGARHVPLHELPARMDEVVAWSNRAAQNGTRRDRLGLLRQRLPRGRRRLAAGTRGRPRRACRPGLHRRRAQRRSDHPARERGVASRPDHHRLTPTNRPTNTSERPMETDMGLMDLFAKVPAVDGATARSLVDEGAVLLDVRENSEWNAGHAPQAAHLPLGRIAEASKKVRAGKRVVVVCRSGNRSRSATKALLSMGYDAVNLSGGMHAWASAGGQVVDRSGRVGSL